MIKVPAFLTKALTATKHVCGNGLLLARKHAPEIMIGTGIVGFGATIWQTVKATNKTNEILEERDQKQSRYISLCHDAEIAGDTRYTVSDMQNDCKMLKRKTRAGIIKAWFPVVTLAGGSVVCILGGYKIINGRYVATVAAYKVLEAEYDRYRENAIERFGEDVDWQLANDIKADKLEAALAERGENDKIAEENKKRKLRKKAPKTAYHEIHSRIFDPHSERWQRYWNANLMLEFMKQKNRELNDMLKINGHVFENEANDKFGLKRTPEGAVCGWVLNKDYPNTVIDVGIDSMPEEELRRILATTRNEDLWARLHYNSQGIIYNLI